MPGLGVLLKPPVQALGSEPFPGDFAAHGADAIHQLIDEVTITAMEQLGLTEQAVDNRHRLLDPFGVNDQAARLSDSVEQTAEPQRLGAALFEHGRDHVVADGDAPLLVVNEPAVENQPPFALEVNGPWLQRVEQVGVPLQRVPGLG